MKAIELFAGIGGISLAMEWAGIETIAFCERDPYCQKVLKKHWPSVPIFDDIFGLNRQVLEESGVIERGGTVDIISGGFPCQPYSVAGKRRGTADGRDLWPQMFRVIQEIRPRWVVGENVANFANMELDRTLTDLETEGYEAQTFIIPACAVGAPHRRERCFIVAHTTRKRFREAGKYSQRPEKWASVSGIMDDTNGSGCEGQHGRKQSPQPADRCKDVSDSKSTRLERRGREHELQKDCRKRRTLGSGAFISNTCGFRCGQMEQQNSRRTQGEREYGEAGKRHFRFRRPESKWAAEPDVGRVAHGVPDRVDRLRCLGNAVVPQQIYPVFDAIMQIEKEGAAE